MSFTHHDRDDTDASMLSLFADAVLALNYVTTTGWDGFLADTAAHMPPGKSPWGDDDRHRMQHHLRDYIRIMKETGAPL